jgi:hypothetical protein
LYRRMICCGISTSETLANLVMNHLIIF